MFNWVLTDRDQDKIMAIRVPAGFHGLVTNALIKNITKISRTDKNLFMGFNRVLSDINFNC